MGIRHATALGNVDSDGFLIDPLQSCHVSVRAGRIDDLSGPVDPLTHLNRDFSDHELGDCLVATSLASGARIVTDADGGFLRARARRHDVGPLGRVNVGERRAAWLAVLKERRVGRGLVSS